MKKRNPAPIKAALHPRNKHRSRYNFKALVETLPELAEFVIINKYKDESIHFASPQAVKMLNKALLKHYYQIESWDIPDGYLCPPIPGRADYIHYIADLMAETNLGYFPSNKPVSVLDIGVGANCVYPMLGVQEYGMNFIGSDIDEKAIESAQQIINQNLVLEGKIELRHQTNRKQFFEGIIGKDEKIDLSICNPPFHLSPEEADAGTARKNKNLQKSVRSEVLRNFGGQNAELWCEGGEFRFVSDMITESAKFGKQVYWFSSLIAKESHLKGLYAQLKREGAREVRTIPMGQGNKISRVIVWTFLDKNSQAEWRKSRWT